MSKKFAKYLVAASTSGGKFWQVEVVGKDVRTRFGKLGAAAEWSSKAAASPADAATLADKLTREKLRKGYAEAPSPAAAKPAAKTATKAAAKTVSLTSKPVTGVFYFRAWNRYPGGNSDMFTIKIVLEAAPGKAPVVRATYHWNFDDNHYFYPEAPLRLPGAKQAVAALLAAAQAMLDAGISQPRFTVVERRVDNQEYDTEWSSLTLALSVHDRGAPAEGREVLQLVQTARAGARIKGVPPDALSQAFLAAAERVTGIGRVFAFSSGTDAFSKAYKPKAKGKSLGRSRAAVPLYL